MRRFLKMPYYFVSYRLQLFIDFVNRIRLKNKKPFIICNNCLGGFLYHWLKLQFDVPFINLRIENDDFIKMLEYFQEFMNTDLKYDEKLSETLGYPVGIGYKGIKVYFIHYDDFSSAINKWNERKMRMERIIQSDGSYYYPTDRIGVMLSFGGTTADQRKRFDELNWRNKVVFVDNQMDKDVESSFLIKHVDYRFELWKSPLHGLHPLRLIDQYDYVGFINKLRGENI